MKIVIDTNVIASALVFGGRPYEVISLLNKNLINAFVTQDIVDEYRKTYEQLRKKYATRNRMLLDDVITKFSMSQTHSHIEVCRDPDDNKFIECAVDNKCIYIVSGDKDLLVLEKYEDVEILTVSQFLEKYSATL